MLYSPVTDAAIFEQRFFIMIRNGNNKPLPPKVYYTGLYTMNTYDTTRSFDTAFRPVKIDLFFPAEKVNSKVPMSYEEIMDMSALRLNYQLPRDSAHLESKYLADAIAQEFRLDSASSLFHYNTGVYPASLPVTGKRKYPVIIYAAGMNGSSWENIVLFHQLVQQGYIVAALSSVGLYPGYMSAAPDLEEQVKDILFTRQQLARIPVADTSRIGLLSWSMGGSAITKAAMRQPFKCLLSFDGTEIHRYGTEPAWDAQCNEMMRSPGVKPERLTAPYCYLSSEHPPKVDSVFDLMKHSKAAPAYFMKIKGARHEDFSSMVFIAEKVQPSLGDIDKGRPAVIGNITNLFFDEYLKGNNAGFGKHLDSLLSASPDKYSKEY